MLGTFFLLLELTSGVALALFNRDVVMSWAPSAEHVGWSRYLSPGMFVASVGRVIGALGASFEDQHYFRHVTFVDEEI